MGRWACNASAAREPSESFILREMLSRMVL